MPGKFQTQQYMNTSYFEVQVEGINEPLDGFLKVSPISSKTEKVEWKHGMDAVVRKGAGRTVFDDIVLERVYRGLDEFSKWRDRVRAGNEDRRKVSILYKMANGTVLQRYECHNCFPSDWQLPAIDAGSSSPAVEKITLAVERVEQLV